MSVQIVYIHIYAFVTDREKGINYCGVAKVEFKGKQNYTFHVFHFVWMQQAGGER